jgi:hypothetical protein
MHFYGDKLTVIDRPFSETNQLVASLWFWDLKDMAEVMEWAKKYPRPMSGPSDLESAQ